MDVRKIGVLLVISLLLAGCSSSDDSTNTDAPGEPGASGDNGDSNGTTKPAAGDPKPTTADGNAIPVGVLTVDNSTVEVGIMAIFTVNVTDGENDTVTWFIDFGDGLNATGTEYNATESHAYALPGLYNVTLMVSDSTGNATVALPLEVVEAAVAAIPFPDDITFSGSSSSPKTENLKFVLESDQVKKIVFSMDYNEDYFGIPEVDNDADWAISGPGGQGGESATYGKEAPITVNKPNTGNWNINFEIYSAFPVGGMDWTVTVQFS